MTARRVGGVVGSGFGRLHSTSFLRFDEFPCPRHQSSPELIAGQNCIPVSSLKQIPMVLSDCAVELVTGKDDQKFGSLVPYFLHMLPSGKDFPMHQKSYGPSPFPSNLRFAVGGGGLSQSFYAIPLSRSNQLKAQTQDCDLNSLRLVQHTFGKHP